MTLHLHRSSFDSESNREQHTPRPPHVEALLQKLWPRPEVDLDMTVRAFGELEHGMKSLLGLAQMGPIVTIFGGARFKEGSDPYEEARRFARRAAGGGWHIITGGGPGIMEAAARGADESEGVAFGCPIILPFEAEPNRYNFLNVNFDYFFTRKVLMFKEASAFVAFPGGVGTLDEVCEVLNLIIKNRMPHVPVVLVGRDYWEPHLAIPAFKLAEEVGLIKIVDSDGAAFQHIKNAQRERPGVIDKAMIERAQEEFLAAMEVLAPLGPLVSVSGSRANSGRWASEQANRLGKIIGELGYPSLTSEYTEVTTNLHSGVVDAGGKTAGFVEPLMFSSPLGHMYDPNLHLRVPSQYPFVPEVISHKFALASVLFPGHFGTLSRAFQLMTAVQTEKVPPRPIIGVGEKFWGPIKDILANVHLKQYKSINPNDLNMLLVVDSVNEIPSFFAAA